MTIDVWNMKEASGRLSQVGHQDYSFKYDEHAQSMVSLTMPVRKHPYSYSDIPPAFQTYLPEGNLLKEISKRLGDSIHHRLSTMDILKAVGQNNVGHLNFTKSGEPLIQIEKDFNRSEIDDSDDELEAFKRALNIHFLSGISGVQPKFLSRSMSASNLIVKSYDPDEFPCLTVVEQITMELARESGIQTANTSLSSLGHVLFVERFDIDKNGNFLHMEELCSILGRGTSEKYSLSFEHIAEAVAAIHANSLTTLFKQITAHVVLRNGDSHLKNFAILDGKISPMYDAVCTSAWLTNDKMAISMHCSYAWPTNKELSKFGQAYCNLPKLHADRIIRDIQECISGNLDSKINAYLIKYNGLRFIHMVLHNMSEKIQAGCGLKKDKHCKMQSIQKVLEAEKSKRMYSSGFKSDAGS